jgi:hypothetical protein
MRKNIKYVSVKPEIFGQEPVEPDKPKETKGEKTKDKLKELKKFFTNSVPL